MRLFLSLDETDPRKPIAVLHVNGRELALSEIELHNLSMEIVWAKEHISEARRIVWSNLAEKYRD